MGGFFRIDGPFFKYGTILCDLMILSIFWTICSLPLFSIGIATTSMFYVTTRLISSHEGYVTKDFFKSFRQNFLQATLSTIIIAIVGAVLFFNIYNLRHSSWQIAVMIQFVLAFELLITTIYLFPLIARFKMGLFESFKSAFFMANRHIFTTITCLALLCAMIYVNLFVYPIISLFLTPGLYAYLSSFMIMRVFKKYTPELDADISADGKNILEEKHKKSKEN